MWRGDCDRGSRPASVTTGLRPELPGGRPAERSEGRPRPRRRPWGRPHTPRRADRDWKKQLLPLTPPGGATRQQSPSGHTPEPVPAHGRRPLSVATPTGRGTLTLGRRRSGAWPRVYDKSRPFPAFTTEAQSPTQGVRSGASTAPQSHGPVLLKRRPKRGHALLLTLTPFRSAKRARS